MILKRIFPFTLALAISTAIPTFSQVQLFEAEVSGIVPFAALKWNQGIQEYVAGLEYNIDGRASLGFSFSKPLKDTIAFDPALKSYTINPYAIFEFIEPDNLKTFSFAIRTDYIHEDASKKSTSDGTSLNSFSRTQIGGGPIFALRIFNSDKIVMIPTAAYEIFYVTTQTNQLISGGTKGNFPKDNFLWHDLIGSCPFHFIFDELNGMVVEPKVTAKFGEGHQAKELLNVSLSLGYVRSF